MSATKAWTKEQIAEAKAYGETVSELIQCNEDLGADYRATAILYDALTAAERERDQAVALLREARGILPPFDLDAMRRIDTYLQAHTTPVDTRLRDAGEAENKGENT